ncbi:MAG TPA: 4Fe-4S dicluster domain-containing protein, partial [Thermoanaerobaculaceae bacterium]|nr:4Fe-4S dicluster domain-containing protein [Thermoanaerobaculaceae bacterium]
MPAVDEKPKPFLVPEYCKGCGRCVNVCVKGCIRFADEINPKTGLVPVMLDLANCTGCGLCIEACPEPYGLRAMEAGEDYTLLDPAKLFGAKHSDAPEPVDIPAQRVPLPRTQPLIIKGNYATAIGALLAGCRHFYGYPLTPSTEGAELMAKLLPKLGGFYLQAVS